jgi:nucleoside-diphosphate-sugar epimerase
MVKLEALVAGGGGFIGSRLVRALLARNWSVRVLDVQYGDLEKYREKLELEVMIYAGVWLTGIP